LAFFHLALAMADNRALAAALILRFRPFFSVGSAPFAFAHLFCLPFLKRHIGFHLAVSAG